MESISAQTDGRADGQLVSRHRYLNEIVKCKWLSEKIDLLFSPDLMTYEPLRNRNRPLPRPLAPFGRSVVGLGLLEIQNDQLTTHHFLSPRIGSQVDDRRIVQQFGDFWGSKVTLFFKKIFFYYSISLSLGCCWQSESFTHSSCPAAFPVGQTTLATVARFFLVSI